MTNLHSAARALVTGTLPADHDELREAIDVLSRAAHRPASDEPHGCPECNEPDPDDRCLSCEWWDEHWREYMGCGR